MRAILLLVVLLAAGCLGAVDEPAPAAVGDLPALGAALSEAHDHADRALHAPVSVNATLLAFGALSEDGRSLGAYGEIDRVGDLIAVTTDQSADGLPSRIVLLDATALPELGVLSTVEDDGAGYDVKIDERLPLVYGAHGGNVAFSIWDASDPTQPRRAGEAPGAGCHMLHPQVIDGTSYVWCAGVPSPTLYRIEATPDGGYAGVPVSVAFPQSDLEVQRYASYYAPLTPLGPTLLLAPHDMTAQPDPLTGAPLVVVASELQGIRVFDVSVPEAPREVGAWRGEGLDEPMERAHTAMLAKIGDRRIGFAASETYWDAAPVVYIVDFTDLARPALLAAWHPPGIPSDEGGVFTSHNFQVVGDRLYVSVWHAGVYAVDVSDPAHPREVGLRTPAHESTFPTPGAQMTAGDVTIFVDMDGVWDVVVADGYALLSDLPAGIEVVAFDGVPAGDPAYSSFG